MKVIQTQHGLAIRNYLNVNAEVSAHFSNDDRRPPTGRSDRGKTSEPLGAGEHCELIFEPGDEKANELKVIFMIDSLPEYPRVNGLRVRPGDGFVFNRQIALAHDIEFLQSKNGKKFSVIIRYAFTIDKPHGSDPEVVHPESDPFT